MPVDIFDRPKKSSGLLHYCYLNISDSQREKPLLTCFEQQCPACKRFKELCDKTEKLLEK